MGWTCKTDGKGRFRLEIGEMRPGWSQLRLRGLSYSGATSTFAFDYEVDSQGKPNLDVFRVRFRLQRAMAAYAAGDRKTLQALAAELQRRFPDRAGVAPQGRALAEPARGPAASARQTPRQREWVGLDFQGQVPQCLDRLGAALRDQVPVEKPGQCFLQVGGKYFEHEDCMPMLPPNTSWNLLESGLVSAVPTACRTAIPARWFSSCVETAGSCFARRWSRIASCETVDVDVRGVNLLELAVEDGGDGTNSDWGVWIWPQLQPSAGQRAR